MQQQAKEHQPSLVNRGVRSYVLRQGRKTPAQTKAFNDHFVTYGLDPEQPLDTASAFKDQQPLVFEIGIGNGGALAHLSTQHPQFNFIGVEVHTPGIGHALQLLHQNSISNVRLYHADVMTVLTQAIPDNSLARVLIWLPDPWPKKRHHKRRLIQTQFLTLLHRKMHPQGMLHFASDWLAYVEWTQQLLADHPGFLPADPNLYLEPPFLRPSTRFAERGLRLGQPTTDLIYFTNSY